MDATLHSILFGKYRNELIQADLPAAEAPFYRIADIGHIAKATGGERVENSAKSLLRCAGRHPVQLQPLVTALPRPCPVLSAASR